MNLIQLDNIYLDPASKRIYVVYNGEYIELCTVNNLGFNERIGYGFGNMFNNSLNGQKIGTNDTSI